MSHRLAAGDLAGLAIVTWLLPPVAAPAGVLFPIVAVSLFALLGGYASPDGGPSAWELFAVLTAITGALAATTLAAGAAADPHHAIALWTCSLGALRARQLALRPRPAGRATRQPPSAAARTRPATATATSSGSAAARSRS